MLMALEAWSRKGGTPDEEGRSASSERTLTNKGKQPMREEHQQQGSSSKKERREVPLFDMRLRKLEIPIFKGEVGEDPIGWFHRVERYFVVNRLTEKDKLDAAVLCLEGEALEWHQWEEERTPMTTWAQFKEQLLLFAGEGGRPTGSVLQSKAGGDRA